MSSTPNPVFRMRLLMGLTLAVAVFVLVRFILIMLTQGNINSPQPPAPAERGAIVDRNGRPIALQTRLWSVTAWKPSITDPVKTAETLAEILGDDAANIGMHLTGSTSRFVFIKRNTTDTEADALRPLLKSGKLPGIGLEEEQRRHYPLKFLAAPLIGYVGTDNVGLDGIEYAFDRVLTPGDINASSDRIYGSTVHLTLDMNIQFLVEKIVSKAMEKHRPDSMMVLVMDAKSAEIIAWVSLPSFDPNNFGEFDPENWLNRPLVQTFEPGSVFKVFTWSAILDNGGVLFDDLFDTSGGYEPDLFKTYSIPPINDLSNHGVLDIRGAIVHSSNVAVALASETIQKDALYNTLKDFGFGAPTGIPLPGESHGILKPVSQWSFRSKPTIAIGQEVGVSAVQIMAAATVLANGGILLKPRIISEVTAVDGSIVKSYPRTTVRDVISPKTAKIVLDLMEQAVADPGGTARRTAVPGLRISAKSGTAQILDPETGTYSASRFLSSVLAILPTDDPSLIVYVVLENPQSGSIYGAQTAAPVVREIVTTIGPLRGIPMAGNSVLQYSGTDRMENPVARPLGQPGESLHDMTGYSKRMLLSYLSRKDINWTIHGNGWVQFQFPPPGTVIENGMNIFLQLGTGRLPDSPNARNSADEESGIAPVKPE